MNTVQLFKYSTEKQHTQFWSARYIQLVIVGIVDRTELYSLIHLHGCAKTFVISLKEWEIQICCEQMPSGLAACTRSLENIHYDLRIVPKQLGKLIHRCFSFKHLAFPFCLFYCSFVFSAASKHFEIVPDNELCSRNKMYYCNYYYEKRGLRVTTRCRWVLTLEGAFICL